MSRALLLLGADAQPAPPPSGGLIVLPNEGWKYKVVDYTDATDYSTAADSAWATATAPFGNNAPDNGVWPNGKTLWLHRRLDPSYDNITIDLLIEDHGTIYMNGTLVGTQPLSGSGTAAGRSIWQIPNNLLRTDGQPNLLAIKAEDEQPPAGDTFVRVGGIYADVNWAFFTGDGDLTAQQVGRSGKTQGSGEGFLTVEGQRNLVAEIRLMILNPELDQAPGSLDVLVTEAWPTTELVFTIDGIEVWRATTDTEGTLGPASVPVPDTVLAGTHTLEAAGTGTEPSTPASASFTVLSDPQILPAIPGPDANPVPVPEADPGTGVHRWVFQDLTPGGLGSWVLPHNPATMTNPHLERVLTPAATTAHAGMYHVFESGLSPKEWTFTGVAVDQATYDQLLAYATLRRRFYIIDHRQRAWQVTLLGVELVPRLQTDVEDVGWTDWVHDYTAHALVYDQTWTAPA